MTHQTGPTRLDPGVPSCRTPPIVSDHELLGVIGAGSYGEVWLDRTVMGTYRAVKILRRDRFSDARPYDREYAGIQN